MSTKYIISRRNFLRLMLGTLSGLAGVQIIAVIARYLSPTNDTALQGGIVSAGPINQFEPGSVTEFSQSGFFIVRTDDGGFLSVYRRCPHLGCTVTWEEENELFKCPCHASTFDFFGDFSKTPVPRALDTFQVTFEDGQVFVNLGQPIHREHYSPDQLAYPQSSI